MSEIMRWAAVMAAMLVACGCSSRVTVSASVPPGSKSSGVVLQATNGITVDRIRIALRDLMLKLASAQEEEDYEEIAAGPFLVDLSGESLRGSLTFVASGSVRGGQYDYLFFAISKVDPESAAIAGPAWAELATRGASLIVDGSIDGAPFSFASATEVELQFGGAFTVGERGADLVLTLDPATWFSDSAGARLDPRNPSVRGNIEQNIEASMQVTESN